MRARSLVLAMVLSVLGPLDTAGALPILETPDAEDLSRRLAEATAVQGICYGWRVHVRDESGNLSGTDLGSSRGVGLPAEHESCPRFMVFQADLYYTSESSEASDSASFLVFGNVGGGPDDRDLRRVGVSESALLGAKDDLAVANAVLALPALVAERGLAPPVPAQGTEGAIPAADRATNTPGSDWTRAYGAFILLSVVLVVGGLGWAAWAWAADRFHFPKTADE